MPERSMKIPGPDHPITIEADPNQFTIAYQGEIIADTRNALRLSEANYAAVLYIPRADVDMARLTPSDHRTYCPYKGECSYFSLGDGALGRNAVWSYESPFASVAAISGHLAFYPDRFEIAEAP